MSWRFLVSIRLARFSSAWLCRSSIVVSTPCSCFLHTHTHSYPASWTFHLSPLPSDTNPDNTPQWVSDWILTSSQLHSKGHLRTIKLNHKQTHTSKPLIYINPFSSQSTKTNPYTSIKQNTHTPASNTNFWRVSPFSTPVNRAQKARTCWYHQPFYQIYWHQIKEKKKKRNGQKQ